VRAAAVVLSSLVAGALPMRASAGEPSTPEQIPDKARKLVERGRELHGQGDYGRAIIAFKEAYVLAPSPGLLFNLGQAYRLQGNCDDAAIMYRRYLATNPSPDARALAETHLATVERCIAQRGLHIPFDESMAYLRATPPEDKTLALVAAPTAPAPEHAHSRRMQKWIGLGVATGGGLALASAGFFAYRSHEASVEVEERYARGDKWKNIAPVAARGEQSATLARAFGIGGGLAAVAGVTVFLLGERAERRAQSLSPLSVTPTRRGAEVSLAWHF
jgi:tetratricopeptide (TPR) repeat protein